MQSKGWLPNGFYLTLYPWVLEYRIPLYMDDALDSLDDHLNRRRIPPLRGNGKKISHRARLGYQGGVKVYPPPPLINLVSA